jgi:NADPH:quinone reductase-like Zn-dependent oxidoreductase
MKAYTVEGTGLDSLRIVDRPEPGPPGPGEVVVDVRAVSLNYRDLMVADGRYGGPQDPPIVPCSDMAGVVLAVGSDVRSLKVGDRVLNAPFRFWPAGALRSDWARTFGGGLGVDGVLAEQVAYPAVSLIKVPDSYSFAEASTFTVAGLTAWAAVVTHGHVLAGEWVLLHGTGGVSIFGAQIARLFGARTILSTSDKNKAEQVKNRLHVDATIDYHAVDWPSQVREITGGQGVDVVVETVGGSSLAQSVKACNYGGRIGLIGVLGGVKSQVNVINFLVHQVTVRGIYMESAEELQALVRAFAAAECRPWIDREFDYYAAADAYAHLNSQKHLGKVVLSRETP